MATRAVDFLQIRLRVALVRIGGFGIVANVTVAGHALHLRMHALGKCFRHEMPKFPRLARGCCGFELTLAAVVASEATRVIQRRCGAH